MIEWSPRMLELVVLDQVEDFFMPFDLTVEGFHDDWWDDRVGRVDTGHYDWLSFVDQGEEVARAEIDYDATLGGDYTGPPFPRDVIDVTFIEVRKDRRRNGIGRAVMAHIVDRYPGRVLIAFSEEADEFWSSIGWYRRPRVDGDTNYRPLFVWDGRAESESNASTGGVWTATPSEPSSS